MTELRLIASAEGGAGGGGIAALPARGLRPGPGLPADLVRAHQRERLVEAAATALDEQGYGRLTAARVTALAGVSSRTFYQHFEDLWACMLAAYETEAAHLCVVIEGACGRAESDERGRAGIAAALEFLAADPAVARLLCSEPPPQVTALAAARRELVDRLAGLLHGVLTAGGATPLPGLERRLVGAAMGLASTRAGTGAPSALRDLEPELTELLLATL